jgi:hypothetical protein
MDTNLLTDAVQRWLSYHKCGSSSLPLMKIIISFSLSINDGNEPIICVPPNIPAKLHNTLDHLIPAILTLPFLVMLQQPLPPSVRLVQSSLHIIMMVNNASLPGAEYLRRLPTLVLLSAWLALMSSCSAPKFLHLPEILRK